MKNRIIKILAVVTALCLFVLAFTSCTEKLKVADNVFNVLENGLKGDGKTDDSKALADLIDECKTDGAAIVFPKGKYRFDEESIVFPSKISVVVLEGAEISVAEGCRFRINGSFNAPVTQIFFGDGSVGGFGAVSKIPVEWFGAVPDDGIDDSDAVRKALLASTRLNFGEGTYDIDKTISFVGVSAGSGVDLIGLGKDKTKISLGNNIIAFDCHSDGASTGGSVFDIYGIGFYEKENKMTSMVAKVNSGWVNASKCHFEGLDTGLWFDYVGYSNFTENTAKDTRVVFEISEMSMFIYFEKCEADHCGTLVKAVVGPSGGVSNGIFITNCKARNGFAEDIYITENQCVWISHCEFVGGTGGKASVYFKNHLDSGIDDCIISSAKGRERNGIIYEGMNFASLTKNNISDCEFGIYFNMAANVDVTDNVFSGNNTDITLASSRLNFFSRNVLSAPRPIYNRGGVGDTTFYKNYFKCAEYDIPGTVFQNAFNMSIEENVFNWEGETK